MIGEEYKSMTRQDLQHACDARAMNSDGTKPQLIRKLTVGDWFVFGLAVDWLADSLIH